MNALLEAINLLTQLLAVIPQGTALWLQYSADRDALQAVYAKGPDYKPTDADWAPYDTRSAAAEAGIDANAERAKQ